MQNVNPKIMKNIFVPAFKDLPVYSASGMKIQQNLENALWKYAYIFTGISLGAEWPKTDQLTDFKGL